MKIKKNNLSNAEKYTLQNYPSSGIFLNTSETGSKDYIYVNMFNGRIFLLDNEQNCEGMFEEDVELELPELLELSEIQGGFVSETFALRMLAISLSSGNYKDIK